jgi:L-seryl-tRNA(Ser) seleniumtransferase
MGADLVTFSGGKGIRGPQASGLLAGRRSLIDAARLHNAPNHAIGRPMKVGKEEIVGLVTALEMYAARDHEAELADWRRQAQVIVDAVADVPGIAAALVENAVSHTVPHAVLSFTPRWIGSTSAELVAALRAGDPPIYVAGHVQGQIGVNPHMLEPGEAELIAQRLSALLRP